MGPYEGFLKSDLKKIGKDQDDIQVLKFVCASESSESSGSRSSSLVFAKVTIRTQYGQMSEHILKCNY